MKQLTKQQEEALRNLKGLSKEEIIEYLGSLSTNENYIIQDDDEIFFYDGAMHIRSYNALGTFEGSENHVKYDYFYKAKDEAKQELAKRHKYLHMKIVNRIRELNEGWRPYFKNYLQNKYHIIYTHDKNKLIIMPNVWIQYQPLDMYLKSSELAQQLIDEMKDELIEYFTYENWDWLELPKESEDKNNE